MPVRGAPELKIALGHFRLFRLIRGSSPVVSDLLKLNLLLCAIVVFFYTLQVSFRHVREPAAFFTLEGALLLLPIACLATIILTFLAAIIWFWQRPKRLKIRPDMLVLRTDLDQTFFSEITIPWRSIRQIEVTYKRIFNDIEFETRVEITTSRGLKHFILLDDLLVDNSEASFINAVQTFAPWSA